MSLIFTFPGAPQNPVIDDGNWLGGATVGVDWNDMKTVTSPNRIAGAAFVGGSGADDCLAWRNDFWTPDQSITGVVYRDPAYVAPDTHEIQLHLRTLLAANSAKTYEFNYDHTSEGYQLAKWNGPLGDVTVITDLGPTTAFSMVTDDVVELRIVGTEISLWYNGTNMSNWSDNTYSTGKPGIGAFVRPGVGADQTKFCWKQLTITSLNPTGNIYRRASQIKVLG
jgi:hypothetical protein